jgi:chemotaxis protein methyltransferase CheR
MDPISPPVRDELLALLRERAGLHFSPARYGEVEAGALRVMAAAQLRDAQEWLGHLRGRGDYLDELLSELCVGETYFRRDAAQFDFIRSHILPDLCGKRPAGHALRIWSAGCATGEEAYSLAFLLEEAGLSGQARILATDINRRALVKAEDARYGAWSLRGMAEETLARYFRREGDRWAVEPRFRKATAFRRLNLARDPYPSLASGVWAMDLILCRNVLIYFDARTVEDVARRLHDSLAEGGWLLTAPSDPPLWNLAPWENIVTPAGVLYRRREAVAHASDAGPIVHAPPADPPQDAPPALPIEAAAQKAPHRALPAAQDALARARQALHEGDYPLAEALSSAHPGDPEAWALRVRALGNAGDPAKAQHAAEEGAARHPHSPELHFLNAIFLLNKGRESRAIQALRRTIYLDRRLAVAHFLLGSILETQGRHAAARRAYRNARDLARGEPQDAALPLGDGERAGHLAAAAALRAATLASGSGGER